MIKHSIIMITYNQEDYIIDALESIFTQDVLPYEVIIGDDCSKDNTRSIILEYKEKYPDIIKPIFNEETMGIYRNLNNLKEHGVSGDVVSFLSGDDLFKNNMFSAFNRIIEENNLQPQSEKFLILSNTLHLFTNGKESLAFNNYKSKDKNLIKLRLRNKIGNRYTGISRNLFDFLGLWNIELGLWVDYLHSLDLYINCDSFYFLNQSFPVYRLGSGVTSTDNKNALVKSYIKVLSYCLENYHEYIDIRDSLYIKKVILKSKVELNGKIKDKINFFFFWVLSFSDVIFKLNSFKTFVSEVFILFPVKTIKKWELRIRNYYEL